MATVPYTQWQPFVQVYVPDCPKALIIEAIRQACIEFCQYSRFWRKELDAFYTVATDEEYELITPTDSTIADILLIKVNKEPLEAKTQDDLESIYSEWREQNGKPKYFFMRDKTSIVFVPIPDAAYPVRLLVALKPTQIAQGVDSIIFEEHKEAIKFGALAYLMMMPNKEWSDQNGSVFYKQQFIELSTKAKTIAEQGFNLRKSFRVKPNYF